MFIRLPRLRPALTTCAAQWQNFLEYYGGNTEGCIDLFSHLSENDAF
jgi:hypothetical protein